MKTKQEIMEALIRLHQRHGIMFTSEQDGLDYYKELVDLIQSLST